MLHGPRARRYLEATLAHTRLYNWKYAILGVAMTAELDEIFDFNEVLNFLQGV